MKLIAINTIRRGSYSTSLKISHREQLAPGDEFEAGEVEAKELIATGAARRKTREVIDDDAVRPPRRRRRSSGSGAPSGNDGIDTDAGDDEGDGDDGGDEGDGDDGAGD